MAPSIIEFSIKRDKRSSLPLKEWIYRHIQSTRLRAEVETEKYFYFSYFCPTRHRNMTREVFIPGWLILSEDFQQMNLLSPD